MATLNKTFPFVTTLEGFTGVPFGASMTMSYDGTYGNPSGSLKSRNVGRNKAGTSYWEWTGTWEDLGITPGTTVDQVRINNADNRCTEWNVGDAATIGPYSIYNSAGDVLIATLWAGRSPTGVEGSWTSIGNQAYQAIGASYQASNTSIRIRLYNTSDLGNNPAAAQTFYDDNISLDIDYVAGSDDLTAVGITANPVVGTPAIGQEHVLTAAGITANPVVGIPVLLLIFILTSVGILATPVLGTPTITHIHVLTATAITADPVVGTPAIEQTHVLTATGITANPVVGTPAIEQTHVLTATGITANPVVGTPTLSSGSANSPVREQNKDHWFNGIDFPDTVAFDEAVTEGSLLVVCFSGYLMSGTNGITISDDKGNTWQAAEEGYSNGNHMAGIWYAKNAAAGVTTLTINDTEDEVCWLLVVLIEYSNVNTTAPIDQSNEAITESASWDSGDITTTQADTVLIGLLAHDTSPVSLTEDSPWDLIFEEENQDVYTPISVSEIIATSTLTDAYTGEAAFPVFWYSAVVAFKAASATDDLVAVGITTTPALGTPTLGVYSVFDNFNRSNGDLDGSTASGGGTWVEFENTLWEIAANAAKVAFPGGSYVDQSARLDGVDFDSDDHEVEVIVTITNPPGLQFLNVGVIARKEDNATKTFYGYVFRGPAYLTRLFKFVDGAYTTIGDGTTTCEAGDTLRLRCVGDQISGYLNDVLEVGPITDTDIAGPTHIQGGLFLDGGAEVGDYSVDNWGGRNLPSDTDDLTSVGITANPVLDTPSIGQKHVLTATGITANPVLGTPTIGRISNLNPVDITANPVLGTPTITHIHVLTATGITADPVVGTPVIGTEGEDVLTAVDITADPVLDTPSIGQQHVLDSVGITADPVVGTPSIGRISNLTATDITADPVVGTPTIERIPNLDAVDIVASPVLGVPTVSRVSNLIAVGITTGPVLDTPSISQTHALDSVDITVNPVLGTPVLGSEGEENLEANDLTVTPVTGTPAIGQTHVLSAVGITTTPVTDTPTIGLAYVLDATSIETTPAVDTPAIGQTHALSVVGIITTPAVGTPVFGQSHTLNASGIITTPTVDVSTIGQVHALDATTIVVSPLLGAPSLGQTHILDAVGITTTPELGVASFELVDGFVVIVFSAYQPEMMFNEYQPEVDFTLVYTED